MWLLETQAVQGALAMILVALIGWAIQRWSHTRHVVNLAILAYKYAEKEGLLQQIDGTGKLAIFMLNFIARYEEEYGKTPTPTERAVAVKAAEKEVLREDHAGKS